MDDLNIIITELNKQLVDDRKKLYYNGKDVKRFPLFYKHYHHAIRTLWNYTNRSHALAYYKERYRMVSHGEYDNASVSIPSTPVRPMSDEALELFKHDQHYLQLRTVVTQWKTVNKHKAIVEVLLERGESVETVVEHGVCIVPVVERCHELLAKGWEL